AAEVVRRQDFAVDDREVDLDLVEPGGVYGQVDQVQGRPLALEPAGGGLAAGTAAGGFDPVHPPRRGGGLGGHDPGDEPAEWLDPGPWLAAAEDPGAVDVPGGQVLQRAAAGVLELGARRAARRGGQRGMPADPGLDGGLLIRADHIVVLAEWLALEG